MQTGKIRKLVFAIAAAFGLSATGAENVTGQLPEMSPEFQNLKWETGRFGKLATRDGRQILSVTVPEPEKQPTNCAGATVDLKPFRGQSLCFMIRVRAIDVTKPAHSYNGVKFMLNYRTGDGEERWHHPSNLFGSFDWKLVSFTAPIDAGATTGRLMLGLQESAGTVEFDLSTLRVFPMSYPRVNQDYKVRYPEKIANTPPMRGVMSPHQFKDGDLETLAKWNVNLVRAQICRDWGKAGTDRDLAEYDRWLNSKLDHLEQVFKEAEKYGIRFVIDLHSPPGGRDETRDMCMFYEKPYADHFVEVWKRIATRFKGNPSVWGYDLVNEPVQTRPAPYDYWNLQRMAAEAVRAIDPDTPIIIESNMWDSAPAYEYLSPLAMDNVIYQVHMYNPGSFTHQGVNNTYGEQGKQERIAYPGVIDGAKWDKEMIRKSLKPVRDFQLRHNARIYVGEFSAIAWAPGAEKYLADCISVFDEYGWDWTYHAFREWNGWSVEHEGSNSQDLKPSAGNPRKDALLEGFRKNVRK